MPPHHCYGASTHGRMVPIIFLILMGVFYLFYHCFKHILCQGQISCHFVFESLKTYLNLMEKIFYYPIYEDGHVRVCFAGDVADYCINNQACTKVGASSSRIENCSWKVTSEPGRTFNNNPLLFAARCAHTSSCYCWCVKENYGSSDLGWLKSIFAFFNSFYNLSTGHRKVQVSKRRLIY